MGPRVFHINAFVTSPHGGGANQFCGFVTGTLRICSIPTTAANP
jgi:hypothetical protein